jgi:deazaflavin-dependent oxidoreductase (nitroreductase family)
MPKPPPPGSPFWKLWELGTRGNIALFRLTGGRRGSRMFGAKAPILLLHHVGAKSGKERVSPVIYLADGDDLVLVASKGGVDKHPAWLHNLRAHPETVVEVPREGKRRVRAREADDRERERLWPKLDEIWPPYKEYRGHTERKLPIVVLERA